MSFLRLLTAGRSLVGLKKAEVRYQLPGGKALPKFGSKKNPFRATVLPEKAEPSQESANQGQGNPGAPNGATAEASRSPNVEEGKGRDPKGLAKMSEERAVEKRTAPDQSLATTERRRGSAVKAFLLWGRAKKVKGRGLSGTTPLVQGELSLDSVKVMRNDLSESDLEVVRARRPAAPKGDKPVAESGLKPGNALPGWGAAAGRLLGLGKL